MCPLPSLRFTALLLTALIVITGSSLQAQASKPDATPTFTAIHMINKTNGWAVVTVPNPHSNSYAIPGQVYPATLASLLHTQDGGRSWTDVTPALPTGLPPQGVYGCDCSDNGLAGFFFLDDSHAWVMINDAGSRGNQIYNGISVRATQNQRPIVADERHRAERPVCDYIQLHRPGARLAAVGRRSAGQQRRRTRAALSDTRRRPALEIDCRRRKLPA